MGDWFNRHGDKFDASSWLRLDSWIDSSIAETWERIKDSYNAASSFAMRFRLSGWKRLANEAASEALSLGAGGLVVMYMLALPAFMEVNEENYLTPGKYSVKFLDSRGNEIGKRGINLNDAIPLEEIPEVLIRATMATEDRRFYDHFGVDVIGTMRALVANVNAGETVQGGSTLTQQLAKNLFLSSERSLQRKIKEVFLSFWLESRLTKQEILKLYLDRAYMGGGAFGVEAAAQFYFGKSVREVNMAEAAMMAGLFKAPTKYAPHVNLPAARARANDVLSNLVEAGFYTAGQIYNARLNPAKVIESRGTASPDWFLDYAYEEIQRVMEGRGQYVLTARTTVDLTLQQSADHALQSTIRLEGRAARAKSGALVAMEPEGAVRALVGGLDYGESQFNRAIACAPAAGLVVQALCLCDCARERLHDKIDRLRQCRELRQLVAEELQRRWRLGPLAADRRCLQDVAQYHRRRPVAQGGAGQGRRDDPAARRRGREEDLLDGAGRYRHHAAAAYRRLCHLRQWRQAREALRHPGGVQLEG